MNDVKPVVELQYIPLKILEVNIKKQELERKGFTYVELSPEEGARHLSQPLKQDETILCISYPVK
jgi:hypothetical protein